MVCFAAVDERRGWSWMDTLTCASGLRRGPRLRASCLLTTTRAPALLSSLPSSLQLQCACTNHLGTIYSRVGTWQNDDRTGSRSSPTTKATPVGWVAWLTRVAQLRCARPPHPTSLKLGRICPCSFCEVQEHFSYGAKHFAPSTGEHHLVWVARTDLLSRWDSRQKAMETGFLSGVKSHFKVLIIVLLLGIFKGTLRMARFL